MKTRELILDSVVILADVLKEKDSKRITDMKRDAEKSGIGLLITRTVKTESQAKAEEEYVAMSIMIRDFQDSLRNSQSRVGVNYDEMVVSERDVSVIQDFFRERILQTRTKGRKERLSILEDFIFDKVKNAPRGTLMKDLVLEANGMVVRMDVETTTSLGVYQQNMISYDATEGEVKALRKGIRVSKGDAHILIESSKYHEKDNPRTLFVTLDYREIMKAAKKIEELLKLKCRDPLYAVSEVVYL